MDPTTGIPNFWNVVTNVPFLALGVWGLARLRRARQLSDPAFFNWAGVWVSCVALAFGSGLYHWLPFRETLAVDRMGICAVTAFMAAHALTAGLALRPSRTTPLVLLVGLWATIGVWLAGAGLALYVSVRVVVTVGAVGLLFYAHARGRLRSEVRPLLLFVTFYASAKLAEANDQAILAWTGVIAGHPLKHVFAAFAIGSLGLIMVAEQRAPAPIELDLEPDGVPVPVLESA